MQTRNAGTLQCRAVQCGQCHASQSVQLVGSARRQSMFDIMNADQLINAVKRRTALWDPRHIGHNNRLLINKLWEEVAQEVCIDKHLAKSKWRGLRDYYRQEMKKQANYPAEGAAEYRSSWVLFDQMSFVRNTILPRKQREGIPTIVNTGEMDVDNNSEFYEDDPVNVCIPKLEPQLEMQDFLTEHARVSPDLSDYHELRRNLKQFDQLRVRDLGRDCELEIKKRKVALLEKTAEDNENDDLQFFRSLLPDLANLSRAKKSFIRLKIQELIHREVHSNEGFPKEDC